MKQKMKKGLLYGAFTLFYLAITLYTFIFNNTTGWGLFFFFSMFFFCCIISLLPSLRKIEVETINQKYVHLNESLPVTWELYKKRPTFFPIARLTIDSPLLSDTSAFLYFFTGSKRQLDLTWKPDKRGVFSTQPIQYQGSDLFFAFSKAYETTFSFHLVVLPTYNSQIEPLINHLFSQTVFPHTYGEMSFAVKSFRQYQTGDSLKYIDWKLSSKRNELIFREYEVSQQPEKLLIFWGSPSEHFEEMLSLYYSIQEAYGRQALVKQQLFGDNIQDSSRPVLEDFASIQPFQTPPVISKLLGMQLFIFTTSIDENLDIQLSSLKRTNQVKVYTYDELSLMLAQQADSEEVEKHASTHS